MQKKVDEFLRDIKNDSPEMDDQQFADLLDKKPKVEEPIVDKDEEDDKPKARRYRRMEEKYQKEREANIVLNERLKVLSEFKNYTKQHEGEVDPDFVKMFGTTEDGQKLTSFFKDQFNKTKEEAKRSAIAELKSEQELLSKEEKINSDTIDTAFETIEEKFNVDLSGNTKASKDFRNGFIDFVEKISPKDSNGDIREYADFETAFEAYSVISAKTKPRDVSDRQKELADRSMTRSGGPVSEAPKGPITFKTVGKYLDSLRNL